MFGFHRKRQGIGEILKAMGVVTDADLNEAEKSVKGDHDMRIGQKLVELGKITESQRLIAVTRQKALRGNVSSKDVASMVDHHRKRHGQVMEGLDELNTLARKAGGTG